MKVAIAGAGAVGRSIARELIEATVTVASPWVGSQTLAFQEQSGARIAWIDRLGEGILPTRTSVLQEGDVLHLVMREGTAERVFEVLARGPEADR